MATILIIGSGIVGTATAIALGRLGHAVHVFEQAPAFAEVGAGVSLSPNASRALAHLGVEPEVRRLADLPGPASILHFRSGELLRRVERDAGPAGDGSRFMQMCRSDLLDVLLRQHAQLRGASIELGHRLVDVEHEPAGVVARFANGRRAIGDLLIGCDGLRSQVRTVLHGAGAPAFTGQVAWRFLVPLEPIRRFMGAGSSATYIGPGRIVNRYTVRRGTMVNVVAISRATEPGSEGWLASVPREAFEAEFADWHADVRGLVQGLAEQRLYRWALFDREPLERWGEGPVTLAGDAAHPMLPFMGMGAGLGLEDAVVLSRCIATFGAGPQALRRYEDLRRERAASALRDSRLQGRLYQAADPDAYGHDGQPAELRQRYFDYDVARVAV